MIICIYLTYKSYRKLFPLLNIYPREMPLKVIYNSIPRSIIHNKPKLYYTNIK